MILLGTLACGSLVEGVADPPGPHAAQVAQFGGPRARASRPTGPLRADTPAAARPDTRVYGYLAWWNDDLDGLPWTELTDLALFAAVATPTGGLDDVEHWRQAAAAVARAKRHGVEVHLAVRSFDSADIDDILGDPVTRSRLTDELVGWTRHTGAQGVNIDFEGVPRRRRSDLVRFARELGAAGVGDVVFAVPAVDHAGAWDFPGLAEHATLFVMAYDYHYWASSHAGPVDPMVAGSGTIWWRVNQASISRSVLDLLDEGTPANRVILGLPLYGRGWPATGAPPARSLGRGAAVTFDHAWRWAKDQDVRWESSAESPWFQDGDQQVWYGDLASVRHRIRYARTVRGGLGGVGFWALHYTDDPGFWQMVHRETRGDPVPVVVPTPATSGCDAGGTVWWGWGLVVWLCCVRRRREEPS